MFADFLSISFRRAANLAICHLPRAKEMMMSLDLVRATNTKLVNAHALVAVFVGAASRVGEFSVRALAAAHGTHGKDCISISSLSKRTCSEEDPH
jgi:hypothetical protein